MSSSTIPAAAAAVVKLGKLAARLDVRTLSLARYVDRAELPIPPAELDLTPKVPEWPMYANDRIGDCTTAAAGHMIEAWTAAGRGRAVEISEGSVLDAFDRVKLVDPLTGEEGAVELDVLRDWRKRGIGRHRIGAFARVPLYDHDLVRAATWLFGGLYLGLQLPLSAQGQRTWDWLGRLTGPARPGSWGGHAVDVVCYGPDTLTVVTWGRLQELTWGFWDRYCDEAYCILSPDFLDRGHAPNGFELEALRADLALVTA
ncbi:MAG: hypothetical protein M3P41_04885 [Actinomycetota bacterium]|nr:hypothetical protein [Actinomycetota bacterium]